MTWTVRVLNWADFQHYKDRDPPWIKLHGRRLLDKPGWRRLHGSAAKLLVDVWMLAAQLGEQGELDMTLADLAFRVRLPEADVLTDLQVLKHYAFVELCPQLLATAPKPFPEVETERETEAEGRGRDRDTTTRDEVARARRTLLPIIRDQFWKPDGKPAADWSEGRECSVLEMLVNRGHSVDDLLTLAEGLLLIREANGLYCDTVSWIAPDTKLSFRMLVKARSGAVVLMEHAKRAYWSKANRRPTGERGAVGPIGDVSIPGLG